MVQLAPSGLHHRKRHDSLHRIKIQIRKTSFKISRYLRTTDPRLPHCPPEPGRPTSCTPRRNSSSSSMPKSST
eukprot:943267-Pyramimonas_sp.AAC.1